MWLLAIENEKINLSKLFTGKSLLGQKSHWTIVSLDNCVIGQKSLGQLSPWTIVPWTIVATPMASYNIFQPFQVRFGWCEKQSWSLFYSDTI